MTDYFTKWVEAIPTKAATEKIVMDFLEDKIITRFGVPAKITTNNAKAFSSVACLLFPLSMVLSYPIPRITIPGEMILLSRATKT